MKKTFDGKIELSKILWAYQISWAYFLHWNSELWKQFHEEALALASTTPAPRFLPGPIPLKFQFDSEKLKEYERQLEKFSRKGVEFNRASPKVHDRGISKRKSSKTTSSSLNKISGDQLGAPSRPGNEERDHKKSYEVFHWKFYLEANRIQLFSMKPMVENRLFKI